MNKNKLKQKQEEINKMSIEEKMKLHNQSYEKLSKIDKDNYYSYYTTQELIDELNLLSPYGIGITNNSCHEDYFYGSLDNSKALDNNSLDKLVSHYKSKEWKVTSYFNPEIEDISYSSYNENLDLALMEVIDWCKENLK